MLEQRFALEYRQTPTDQPGLVMRDDGVLQRVKPDGTRENVPGGGGGVSSTPIFRWPFGQDGLFSEVQVQGLWSWGSPAGNSSLSLYGWYVVSGFVGDEIAVDVPLEAGDYDVSFCFAMSDSGGIFAVLADGVPVAGLDVDTYLDVPQYDVDHTALATVTIPASGVVRVSARITGKNVDSSDFNCILQGFSLKKT